MSTVQRIKTITRDKIDRMSDKELRMLARQGADVVNKRINRLEQEDLPVPDNIFEGKRISVKGKSREDLVELVRNEQSFLISKLSTVTGQRQMLRTAARQFEVDNPGSINVSGIRKISVSDIENLTKQYAGKFKFAFDMKGNPIIVPKESFEVSQKEINRYWKQYHEYRDKKHGDIEKGSVNYEQILTSWHRAWIQTKQEGTGKNKTNRMKVADELFNEPVPSPLDDLLEDDEEFVF